MKKWNLSVSDLGSWGVDALILQNISQSACTRQHVESYCMYSSTCTFICSAIVKYGIPHYCIYILSDETSFLPRHEVADLNGKLWNLQRVPSVFLQMDELYTVVLNFILA
jgi:hypothetical protein